MPAAKPVPTFLLTPQALSYALAPAAGDAPPRVIARPLPAGVYVLAAGDDAGHPEALDEGGLRLAIRECMARGGGRVKRARLLLEGPLVRAFSLPIGFRPEDAELLTAVQTEAERYVMFAGAAVAVGFEVLKQEPDRLLLMFAAAHEALMKAIAAAFAAEGVQLLAIEPASVALARGLTAGWEPSWDVSGEPAGVAALLPRRLDVSLWSGSRPIFWRSVMLDGEAVRRGDPEAVAEASMDLQRTLAELPAARWLLADLPPALQAAFAQRPDAALVERKLGPEGWPVEALEAAATGEARGFGLDLLPAQPVRERAFSDRQLLLLGAFGAIAAGILATMLVVDGRVRAVRQELAAVNAEVADLQTRVAAAKREDAAGADGDDLLQGSALVGMALDALRSCTPADTWIATARIEGGGPLRLEGVSLSGGSPFGFARALTEWPEIADVGMPDLKRDAIRDREVYRFTITARAAGAPAPAPGATP